MANPLKELAGETAIYGLSTILARIINFFFVPFYTRLLTTEQYGSVTDFMSWIAVLQVVLALGLETGCFRFANKEGADPKKVYSNALAAVAGLNAAFFACMLAFAGPISTALGYEGYGTVIVYLGGILACDSVTAILFAKLRQEHKALRFAVLKTIKIMTELGVNFLVFFWFPSFCLRRPDNFMTSLIPAAPDFPYVIFSTFASCVVCLALFVPDLVKFPFSFDRKLLRHMLAYSLPLMVTTLPGVANEFLDRQLFRWFDTSSEVWRSTLGIYQASVKLAVIMNLFIQMFRFAAEPFFFQRAKEKHSKDLYAAVMEFFTAFCALVFLGVIYYMDVIALILGRDFRAGIGIVPVMLLSYMILGLFFNVSMWYKLSDRTRTGVWITLAGLAVTAAVNMLFMPKYSYWASAFGHLASGTVMLTLCAVLGAKYYPIPYRWGRILSILALMGVFYGAGALIDRAFPGPGVHWVQIGLNTVLLIIYLAACYGMLRGRYRQMQD